MSAQASPQRRAGGVPNSNAAGSPGGLSKAVGNGSTLDVAATSDAHLDGTNAIGGPTAALSETDRHQMMVLSTFANLELQTTKKTLAETQTRYEEALKENKALAAELKERDQDALQVVEFLRVQLEDKSARVVKLEQRLSSVNRDFNDELQREKANYNKELEVREQTVASSQTELARLRKELDGVALYKRERQEVLLEVARTKESHAELVNRYEKELTKLRFQALEEKVRLRAAEKEMADKFNEEVDNRAMILVDVKAKSIHNDNKRLAVEKAALQQEVDQLITTERSTRDELIKSRREVDLGAQTQEVYAKHGATVARNAKQANQRVRHLEDVLGEMITKFEGEMATMQTDHEETVQKLQQEADEAKKQAKLLRHELVRMRGLANVVVGQRSDLETFFNEALDYVKNQRELEQRMGGGRLSSRGAGAPRSNSETQRWGSISQNSNSTKQPASIASSPRASPSSALVPATARKNRGQGGRPVLATLHPTALDTVDPVEQPRQPHTARQPARPQSDQAFLRGSAKRQQRNNVHPFYSKAGSDPQQQHYEGALVPTPSVDGEDDGPDFAAPPSAHGMRNKPTTRSASTMSPSMSGTQNVVGGGVDFGQLCWADKEKIIRALLFKINKSFYTASGGGGAKKHVQATHMVHDPPAGGVGGMDAEAEDILLGGGVENLAHNQPYTAEGEEQQEELGPIPTLAGDQGDSESHHQVRRPTGPPVAAPHPPARPLSNDALFTPSSQPTTPTATYSQHQDDGRTVQQLRGVGGSRIGSSQLSRPGTRGAPFEAKRRGDSASSQPPTGSSGAKHDFGVAGSKKKMMVPPSAGKPPKPTAAPTGGGSSGRPEYDGAADPE